MKMPNFSFTAHIDTTAFDDQLQRVHAASRRLRDELDRLRQVAHFEVDMVPFRDACEAGPAPECDHRSVHHDLRIRRTTCNLCGEALEFMTMGEAPGGVTP